MVEKLYYQIVLCVVVKNKKLSKNKKQIDY